MPRPIALAGALLFAAAVAPAPGVAQVRIGLNLAETPYYGRELVFADLADHMGPWLGQAEGFPFGRGNPDDFEFAESGTPTKILPHHFAVTLWDRPRGSVGGSYKVTYDGVGELYWRNASRPGGRLVQSGDVVDLGGPSVAPPGWDSDRQLFELKTVDSSDPFRNLSIRAVGRTPTATAADAFQPTFLDRWSDLSSFRYMDWSRTNNSTLSSWRDRPKPGDATQAGPHGVSLERQIDHANATGTQPWFNIPHLADDGYVRSAATLIRDRLDGDLTARVEFSNEVWNPAFGQYHHAQASGVAEGLADPGVHFYNNPYWYAKRSVEVFGIFEDVFTRSDPDGMDRLVRVLGGQAANPDYAIQALGFEDAYRHVDALAIAPYFGNVVTTGSAPDARFDPWGNPIDPWDYADTWRDATREEKLAQIEAELQEAFRWMENHARLLGVGVEDKPYGDLRLFAYEGGQHFVPDRSPDHDQETVDALAELSRMDEMGDVYLRYLQKWEQVGGEDFLLYNSISSYDRHGSWGLLEHEGQALPDAPKLRGVQRFLGGRVVPEPGSLPAASAVAPLLLLRRRPAA